MRVNPLPQQVPEPRQTLPDGGLWMPPPASTFAASVDGLHALCVWTSLAFLVLIAGVLLFALVKWRRRAPDQPAASNATHDTVLEVTWTVIPLAVVMVIFTWGWRGSLDMTMAPPDALTYQVTARQWSWAITHPGHVEPFTNGIWVPRGRPVKFVMSSLDVVHSFYVPAMRTKRDVLPGRYQTVWFEATKVGTFPFFCTEYCGTGHARMMGELHVVEPEEFAAAQKIGSTGFPDTPPAEQGRRLYFARGCFACHSIDGRALVGPTFRRLWGKEEELTDGRRILVDEPYVVESILHPDAKIVKGHLKGQMPPQPVTLDEARKLGAYLRELR